MKKPEMIYKRTGLFIDWDQLESLPEIDTLIDIGIGTNAPQSSLHVDGPGDAVTITTDYKLTMQHYNSSFGTDEKRPFLKKDRVNSPSYGDVLYIGSTGDRSNTNQTAMLFTQSAGIMMGSGDDNGNNITQKWLTVESDKTVLYPNATNGSSNIGDGNFIINDDDNTGFGGVYVNATQPFYGYAAAGSVKAYTHYAESNGVKSLNWNIASGDKMKLDGSGNLEIDGTIKIAGGTPGAGKVLTSDANGNSSWENRSTNYTSLWIGSNGFKDLNVTNQKLIKER